MFVCFGCILINNNYLSMSLSEGLVDKDVTENYIVFVPYLIQFSVCTIAK